MGNARPKEIVDGLQLKNMVKTMMQAANDVSTCSEEQVWTGRSVKTRS